jgi:tetratricopeptide (TPR) repeat protein
MPTDDIAAAEAAMRVGMRECAQGLYDQADDLCFDASERAALGASLARSGLDLAKGRALFEAAVDALKQPNARLAMAERARTALSDEALAARLVAQVEEQLKTLADSVRVAKTLVQAGDSSAARAIDARAERRLDGMAERVAYAQGFVEIFSDPRPPGSHFWMRRRIVGSRRIFAALAGGFRSVLWDADKAGELLEQAAGFAMSGEEQRDLAVAYWDLMADRDQALTSFERALSDLNEKAELFDLGGFIGARVGAADLAKRFSAKAEQKMSSAGERLELAEAVLRDTADSAYAAEIDARAADALTPPNDLMAVAAEVASRRGDAASARTISRKAIGAMTDLGQHLKLLDAVSASLVRAVMACATELASGTPAHPDLAKRALRGLSDPGLARALAQTAEEQVTSVGEMKNVLAAVRAGFAEDTEWLAVLEAKLAKREASQAKGAAFQECEKAADIAVQTLKLADAVMAELDDRCDSQKLRLDAQTKLQGEGWDFSKARKLVDAVSRHLGETVWATRVLKDAAPRVGGFAGLSQVAEAAAELIPSREDATALVRDLLASWGQRLPGVPEKGASDFSKLALLKGGLQGDRDAAAHCLAQAVEEARRQGAGTDSSAELARGAKTLGVQDQRTALIAQAGEHCRCARDARRLARRLLETGFESEGVCRIDGDLKSRMDGNAECRAWAEGIVDRFHDRAWLGRSSRRSRQARRRRRPSRSSGVAASCTISLAPDVHVSGPAPGPLIGPGTR